MLRAAEESAVRFRNVRRPTPDEADEDGSSEDDGSVVVDACGSE